MAAEQGATWWYRRCSIVDETAPTRTFMRGVLDVIDERIAAGGVVYLHCWGGRGHRHRRRLLARSPPCGRGDEVLAILQRLRRREGALEPPIPAERSQRDLVVRWRPGE